MSSTSTANTTPAPIAFVMGAALPRFIWTVRVPTPDRDDYRTAELPLEFQAVDQDELDRMMGRNLPPGAQAPTDDEIVRRVVVGFPALKDVNGQPVDFSPEALAQLMRAPVVRAATIATYLAAMQGAAARKNV